MRKYFLDPAKLASGHCISMDENMMIDMLGNVRLCFNMDRLDLPAVGNVRQNSLQSIWEGSRVVGRDMRGCGYECGAMLCHSR